MRIFAATSLILALMATFGCQSVSSPSTRALTPDDFSACTDYHRRCRDRCAPAEVKEVACYSNGTGSITRRCKCEGGTVHEDAQPRPGPQESDPNGLPEPVPE